MLLKLESCPRKDTFFIFPKSGQMIIYPGNFKNSSISFLISPLKSLVEHFLEMNLFKTFGFLNIVSWTFTDII